MDIFGVLTMLGGLALFLYGMNTLGDGLVMLSGGKLEKILEKLTEKRIIGRFAWRICYGGNSVLLCHNRYGCRLCKLRHHETDSGSRRYHGC